jgi:hypothetical protein
MKRDPRDPPLWLAIVALPLTVPVALFYFARFRLVGR